MLNKFSNLVIEEELNKKEFKIYIFAITILFIIFTKIYINFDIISSIISIFTNYVYNPMFLIPINFYLTYKITYDIISNNFIITRLKDKMTKLLIITTIKLTLLNYIILIMILFVIQNIFNNNGFPNNIQIIEFLLILFKNSVIYIILNIIFILLLYKFNNLSGCIFVFITIISTSFLNKIKFLIIGQNLLDTKISIYCSINMIIYFIVILLLSRCKHENSN